MKKIAVIALIAFSALFAQAQTKGAAYNMKQVHGYKGHGNSQPSGFIVAAVDFDWPSYPTTYLYVQGHNDTDEIIAAYFEGLPTEIIGAGMDTTKPPFHDWMIWTNAPDFPMSKLLDFHPTLAWTGDALPNKVIRLWIFQGLFPCNDAIQNGTLRVGILVRNSKGQIDAYLNEFTAGEIPIETKSR